MIVTINSNYQVMASWKKINQRSILTLWSAISGHQRSCWRFTDNGFRAFLSGTNKYSGFYFKQ